MDKINDLVTDLNENVDLSDLSKKSVRVSKSGKKVIKDLDENLESEIKLSKDKTIKISKNKTKSFDSLGGEKKAKDVDIKNPKKDLTYYLTNIKNFFRKRFLKIKLSSKVKLSRNIYRIFLFLVLLTILLLGSKITIEYCVTSGYDNILALKNDFKDLNKAKQNINSARKKFFIANFLVSPLGIIPNDNIQNVKNLISGGNDISKLLKKGLGVYDQTTFFINKEGGIQNIYFTDLLGEIRDNYNDIYELLYSAFVDFSKIGNLGDENMNAKLRFVKDKLKLAIIIMEVINNNYDTLLSLLGHQGERNYLVVFQNNDEIRPTGGFMGSTALLTLSNGKIINIENSDIYAYEWQINKVYTEKEIAPEGLNKITTTFGLRDANYYPLFKDSSQKIKYFMDMSETNIDGIIYLNQNIILDLLDKIDGVDSKILEEKITSENFSLILSTLVEAKVFKVGTLGTPKQVLFDFAGELYTKLTAEKKYFDYANILLKHIQNRDIVFYSFNTEENSLLWKLGINGETNFNEKFDFNYPVFTSIGGNKTDRYVQYRYDKTTIQNDENCDFETTLEIYKSHHFSKFEDEKVNILLDKYGVKNKNDILNIQGRGNNYSYTQVIIPKDAVVQLGDNQKVYDHENYKVVEVYIKTQKLETSRTTISYTLPNPNCEKYTYKFFKQPGIKAYNINFNILGEQEKYSEIETDFIYKRDEMN